MNAFYVPILHAQTSSLPANPSMPQPNAQKMIESCQDILGSTIQQEMSAIAQVAALRDALTQARAEIARLKVPVGNTEGHKGTEDHE